MVCQAVALLGQGAGLVLRVAGLQGGLLCQVQGLDRGRGPAVGALELGDQDVAAVLDVGASLGEPLVEPGVDADDLAHRTSAGVAAAGRGGGAFGEPDPEGVTEVVFEGGVVGLRGRDHGLEQDPAVDGSPLAVQGLHLVRDRDVGVQVGVPGAGVAVRERGRDQSGHVDLTDPVRPQPGEQGPLFEEGEGVADGGLMGALDAGGGGRVGQRPQDRDTLHRGEGQVEPGDRGGPGAGVLGDHRGELAGIGGFAAVLGEEVLAGHLGADLGTLSGRNGPVAGESRGLVDGLDPGRDLDPEPGDIAGVDLERRTETGRGPVLGIGGVDHLGAADAAVQLGGPLGRERVVSGPEQRQHLLRGHHVPGIEAVDAGHPGTHPDTGDLAALGVVAGQPDVALVGGVQGSDLPGQVVIARPGRQLVDRHRHANQWRNDPPQGSLRACSTGRFSRPGPVNERGVSHLALRILGGGMFGAKPDELVPRACHRR